MSDILSQDEVNALLTGVNSGDIDTESAKEKTAPGVRPYNLSSQERIVRGRMPGLEVANERFSRFFRNSISTLIMRFVDIGIQNVEIIKFAEFMKTVPFPSSVNIFKMNPLKGYSLIVLEAPLVFAFVEFFFGGSGELHVKSEGRAFTSIEQGVIRRVVDIALSDLQNAWGGISPIQPEFIGAEMNPQFVTIVTPSEIVIKIEVHIEVEDFVGKLFFCVPYSMIEPVKEKLYSGIQGERFEVDQRWIARMKEALSDSFVELTAEVGRTKITVGELTNLDVGSVITIGKGVADELDVKVEGVHKFRGLPGYSRGNQAIKITKIEKA